jgi:hypothetical protein
MSNFYIIKKAILAEIDEGFKMLPLHFQVGGLSAKNNIKKQVVLTLMAAEQTNGGLDLNYTFNDYSLEYPGKVSNDRKKKFIEVKELVNSPSDCHMYVCKFDDTIYNTRGDKVVFDKVTEIFKDTIPCLKKLLNAEGTTYKELIVNTYDDPEEAREIIDYQVISRKKLADHIKANNLMSGLNLLLINTSVLKLKFFEAFVEAIESRLDGLVRDCYRK